jgi:spermidine synthase
MIEVDHAFGKHGPIAILRRISDDAVIYSIKNSIQSMATSTGVSLCGYIHAIEMMVKDRSRVLIIGGAGGSLATMLSQRGCAVTVVDDDPAAYGFARTYFGLPVTVTWIEQEGAHFLKSNRQDFDVVVLDACDQNGLISSMQTDCSAKEALRATNRDGIAIVNCVADGPNSLNLGHMKSLFDKVNHPSLMYHSKAGIEGNNILVAGNGAHEAMARLHRLTEQTLYGRPVEVRPYLLELSNSTPKGRFS